MSDEPENSTLALLRKIDAKVDDLRDDFDEGRVCERLGGGPFGSPPLRADVASDIMTLEKRLSDQIVGLRRAVIEYHSSAIGH